MYSKNSKIKEVKNPAKISSYLALEKKDLIIVSISGVLYNVGMILGPYFEGQMAQCLFDIAKGKASFRDMGIIALIYVISIAFVQAMRAVKRFFVRHFSNNTSLHMRHVIYHSLLHAERGAGAVRDSRNAESGSKGNSGNADSKAESSSNKPSDVGADVGTIMTKAVEDVDACAEGMRKFITEIFDTGVVMIAYLGMLIYYDWRLTIFSVIFSPIAYFIADRLKKPVTLTSAEQKESAGKLNSSTLDRISNALTYRIYGVEKVHEEKYEERLSDYEKKSVRANIFQSSLQPIYLVISMLGVIPILIFGGKNVLGTGWTTWDIAAFTAFFSCFSKLAKKSSHAANLFNAVQKAEVSWKRIEPIMREAEGEKAGRGQTVGGKAEHENAGQFDTAGRKAENENAGQFQTTDNETDANSADKTQRKAFEKDAVQKIKSNDLQRAAKSDTTENSSEFSLSFDNVTILKEKDEPLLSDITFSIPSNSIIGITGKVASGKSMLGKALIKEAKYHGDITLRTSDVMKYNADKIDDSDNSSSNANDTADATNIDTYTSLSLSSLSQSELSNFITYMGHESELLTGTIAENVSLGEDIDILHFLDDAEFTPDLYEMPDGINTAIGASGHELSGGQRQRIALARTLAHAKNIIVLDDPFSAVDPHTEDRLFQNILKYKNGRIIFIISHRLKHFPEMDNVIFLEDGKAVLSKHDSLMSENAEYRELFEKQANSSTAVDFDNPESKNNVQLNADKKNASGEAADRKEGA